MAEKNIVDAIARGIVVFDGAMGTTLQRMQLAGTAQDLAALRAQIFGARKAMADVGRAVPVIAQITLDPSGRMLLGSEPLAAAALLTAAGADVMGLNCSTGPREMVDPLRALADGAPLPLSCQ